MKALLLLAGLVVASWARDDNFMCYVCEGEDCADAYTGLVEHEDNCESESYFSCSKSKEKVQVAGVWATVVKRFCGDEYSNDSCGEYEKLKLSIPDYKAEFWYCSCSEDRCNVGTQLTLSAFLLFTALAKLIL